MQYSTDQNLLHLLSIEELHPKTIYELLDLATKMSQGHYDRTLKNSYICNAFFEASTRTICSFELAAKRLGANVINFIGENSSLKKGETLIDTLQTLDAMNFDALVLRHSQDGMTNTLTEILNPNTHIINAGDGCNEHPTQALLDAMTIAQNKNQFSPLKIGIIGDIIHSRVARSLVHLFNKLEVSECRLIGPNQFLPEANLFPKATFTNDMNSGLSDLDVVIVLRVQLERIGQGQMPNLSEYIEGYRLNSNHLTLMKPDAIIMHPGPINHDIEITTQVAHSNQSVILQQVRNGVFLRMAVLYTLLHG